MASTSSPDRQNALSSGIELPNNRRKVEESSRLFDVFINHRGPDVKQTLAAYLYNSLGQLGIRVFLDSEEKELGTSFPSTIETAIRSASVHIAIFSTGYAESPWCLAELVLMLQSQAKIIPVFYHVEPWELRYIEKGVYAGAFLNYEEKDRHTEKIKEWKEALQSVSFTTGYVFNDSDWRNCKEIVSAVAKEVQRTKHLHVAKYPVGLHKLVKDFEKRCLGDLVQDFENQCGMNKAGEKKPNVVGIFGIGGAGKTTLSKELFNQKISKYTRTTFLFDVREAYANYRLPSLQRKLLEDIFGEDHTFVSSEEGTSCLRDRFQKSVSLSFLIVLDDIDHLDQLDALIPMDIINKCGNNLVIVTTRDVGVLVTAKIENGYHLKGLDIEDGRELFCWHAFDQPNPCSGYEDLVSEFVNICGGLPLSLQVLGRHVYKRDLRYWREELKKVSKTLPGDIKERLKISYDSLDNEQKQIFMDVACFFIGKSKTMAMTIWEGSGWSPYHALQTLKDKCLLEEEEITHLSFPDWECKSDLEGFAFKMHDHLRDLGREMANELSHPPRVWRPQHLKSLELKGFQNILDQTEGRCFHSFWDRSMACQITYFIGEPEDSSNPTLLSLQLKYLKRHPPMRQDIDPSIPSWIPLQNLQYLRIIGACFQRLWQSDTQAPSHLKELQIIGTYLEVFPDLSGKSNNMQRVVLKAKEFKMNAWSLFSSLGMKLRSLNVIEGTLSGDSTDNTERTTFTSLVISNFKLPRREEMAFNNQGWPSRTMSGIHHLTIEGHYYVKKILITGNCCQHLQSLRICSMGDLVEADLARVKTLNFLEITYCGALKRLSLTPDLSDLEELKIDWCKELQELPFVHLSSLKRIAIKDCQKLKNVSEIFNLTKLTQLYIKECPELEELSCLARLSCLERIEIDECEELKNITLPTAMIKLSLQNCRNLQRVVVTADLMKPLELYIKYCPQLEQLPSLYKVSCLSKIEIEGCERLQSIMLPSRVIKLSVQTCRYLERVVAIGDLTKLIQLYIKDCPELEELPSLARVSCLEQIEIDSSEKLKKITLPTALIKLSLQSCRDLQRVEVASDLMKLSELYINDCPQLEELPSLYKVSCLSQIEIDGCERLQSITLPTALINLSLHHCRNLRRVARGGDLTKLTRLVINFCPQLEELPSLSRVSCMEKIEIYNCEKLENFTMPTTLTTLAVSRCRHLQRIAIIGDLTKLTCLIIEECPKLEKLPSLCRVTCLEKIVIDSCEKLPSIALPATLISLSVQRFRDLQRVLGTDDITKLTRLVIKECPKLQELPNLCRVSCMEEIRIDSCEKLQNITLPITLTHLSVQRCRDLQRVAGTGDLTKLTRLVIEDCPELEKMPGLDRLSCLEKDFVINRCEKLQSISGIEELHASGYMKLSYCSNAIIRDCIHKLKSEPWRMYMIKRAVDGAESTLNQNLFMDANIGINGVTEIDIRAFDNPNWSELRAVIRCFLVVVGSSTSLDYINKSLQMLYITIDSDSDSYYSDSDYGNYFPNMFEGEWIITMLEHSVDMDWYFTKLLGSLGIMKKGIRIDIKKDEAWRSMQVLRTIVDRLHYS